MENLTKAQKRIFDFIRNWIRESGTTPSLAEIAEEFDITKSGAKKHLEALERKEYIRRKPGSRTFSVLMSDERSQTIAYVPLLGTVAAGTPTLAEENVEGYVAVPAALARWKNVFLLRVMGNSMDEAHILDGDLVLVRSVQDADSGSIVVALIGDEATVKRLRRNGNVVEFCPESTEPEHKPFRADENTKLLGTVEGVIRNNS